MKILHFNCGEKLEVSEQDAAAIQRRWKNNSAGNITHDLIDTPGTSVKLSGIDIIEDTDKAEPEQLITKNELGELRKQVEQVNEIEKQVKELKAENDTLRADNEKFRKENEGMKKTPSKKGSGNAK